MKKHSERDKFKSYCITAVNCYVHGNI